MTYTMLSPRKPPILPDSAGPGQVLVIGRRHSADAPRQPHHPAASPHITSLSLVPDASHQKDFSNDHRIHPQDRCPRPRHRPARRGAASAGGSYVNVEQYGYGNAAGGMQTGWYNGMTLYQDGAWNTAIATQDGHWNQTVIGQQGYGNGASASTYGSGNVTGIAQIGAGNTADTTQWGNGNAVGVIQVGNGNSASSTQVGTGNVAVIVQN